MNTKSQKGVIVGDGGGSGGGRNGGKGDVESSGSRRNQEEELELSMKRLNLLHVQCRELRTTIQRMLEAIPDNAPVEEIYDSFVKSIAAANKQIKDFGTLYNSDEMKKVLDQAKKSRDANPKGIKPWRARDHPDWLDVDK
ncbi:hypothetical protein F4819DRAFT_480257 [Hypoxylon fuscum]|nr:hypothetical protein F4819DRAFT_480257 [Hypoxylon fuscum]